MPAVGESFGANVIRLDGAFNPAILTPDWLLAKELIDEFDREYAVDREHERILVTTAFSGGRYPWLVVEVTHDEVNVTSTDETETPERLREFVVDLLKALPETPVRGLEVTHFWHTAVGEEGFNSIAAAVAPGEPWDHVLDGSSFDALRRRVEVEDGFLKVSVEPSVREGYDVYVAVERYWKLNDPPGLEPTAVVETLDDQWDETMQSAGKILEATLALA